MGLDVPTTNLVVIHSSPSTAWEFSQEVKDFVFNVAFLGEESVILSQQKIFTSVWSRWKERQPCHLCPTPQEGREHTQGDEGVPQAIQLDLPEEGTCENFHTIQTRWWVLFENELDADL